MSSDHIWPILFFVSLAGNLILLFYRPLLRLLRRGEEVSEDEIMAMVEEGEESGAIERNEKELIENVFEFNNTTAEDVMIHRTDMVTLSLDDDEETILSAIRESGLSRFPVYQGNVDDIVGILSTRQYLLNFHVERPQELRALLRPAYFVPETVRADVLFRDMQSKKIHMAVVVDEYGGTSGLVTLEDLLEELVGNIYDEFDPQAEQEIIQLEENLWRVSGSADLEELAEAMDFQLPEDEDRDYDTLGGLVFAQLAVIPEDGSRPVVEALGLRIRVEELCGRRLFLTHGHHFNVDQRPSQTLLDGAGYVVYGHFHVPMRRLEDGVWYWNPGSVSIPKENSWHGCMRMTEDAVQWLDLDGNLKDELR